MDVYFSHSYRDVAINGYFLEHFVREDVPLEADQKTDIWCVAKLERYMSETSGFVSIIPRRPTAEDPWAFSPYIGQELTLARRARVPRLLFVDEDVLDRHPLEFPDDAIPFRANALDAYETRHSAAIRTFRASLDTAQRPARHSRSMEATVVAGPGPVLADRAQDIAEMLRREKYRVNLLARRNPGHGLEDIRLLETLWASELCVFLLGGRLSDAHVALAMAHAHGIPAMRFVYDPNSNDTGPGLSGMIRWPQRQDLLFEFGRQLRSYLEGLVRPVELALSSSAEDAARAIGTTQYEVEADNKWNTSSAPALLDHVLPNHNFVQDEVSRARAEIGTTLDRLVGREASREVCNQLYNGLRRLHFGYEIEAASGTGWQAIRTPSQISLHRAATCLDIVCLFASMLDAAGQNPLVIVLEWARSAHALAGYRVKGEPAWEGEGIADLRGAVKRGDAVLFEATGAVEADSPVAVEGPDERTGKLLYFEDAVSVARRTVEGSDVRLIHFVDVRARRAISRTALQGRGDG